MKMLTMMLAVLTLSAIGATAQDVTGFATHNYPGASAQSSKNPPNPHPDLRPTVGGILVDTAKYGSVMISPAAPDSYGIGKKYLAAPLAGTDPHHQCGPAAHRDTGGIKFFTFEF